MDRRAAKVLTAAALVLACASWARAADKADCANPAWAPERLPGYEIDSCDHKDWAQFQVWTTADGSRFLEGQVDSVVFALKDQKKNVADMTAWKHFVAQAKKLGAVLATDSRGGATCSLARKTPQGEVWYTYTHGSGNAESTGSYTLTTVHLAPLKQEVEARAVVTDWNLTTAPCRNPPWLVKQFPYFKLDGCTESDYDQITLPLPDGNTALVGHIFRADYVLTDPKKDPVANAVFLNYVRALEAIGAKLVTRRDQGARGLLTRKTAQGDLYYLYEHGSGNGDSTGSYSLTYVQVGGPPLKTCKVQLYGVNFDFDKATLRPDAEPVLQQALALFKNDPRYAVEIGGHTDNVGDKVHNRTLSAARAQAVKDWLVAHGVAASRLSSAGYGDSKPLAPNTTEDNRAKNRRVELQRTDCKA